MTSASPDHGPPVPWLGGSYSIKRHGVSLSNCDDEPVQTPGCIQSHGALLVLRPSDLTVLQVSENSGRVLGKEPEDLLGRPLAEVVGDDHEREVRRILEQEPVDGNPLHAFTFSDRSGAPALDVSVHTVGGLAVVEFEATGRSLATVPDYYTLVKKTVARLQSATTFLQFCEVVTGDVRRLTGLDRAMLYRFHLDGHGEVVAESKAEGLPSWLGLHYPAEDIPGPVREVFKKTWVRPVPDINGGLAELVPLVNPETGRPLEMTYCALRGASVMYSEYLQNMGVKASLTMPVRRSDGQLWGMIACHHNAGPAAMPYQVRAACELLAQVVSLHYRAAEDRDHLAYRLAIESVHQRLILQVSQSADLGALLEGPVHLLDGIRATGAALFLGERWRTAGQTPSERELSALVDWIRAQPEFQATLQPRYVTNQLARSYPPAASFSDVASGIIAVPLTKDRRSLLIWFRPEVTRTIEWGGNPNDKPTVNGPHGPRLTPRRSFERFVESVRQTSATWMDLEVDAALALRTLVLELVVSRSERLTALNDDLARSNEELDAFAYVASHDLKEPLRGIHKYAHLLAEETSNFQEEQRARLDRLMHLTVRMDSLLDSLLHFSRVGRIGLDLEEVEPEAVLKEAAEIVGLWPRAGQSCELALINPLPRVTCDRLRLREIFSHLLSNAIKYNESPVRRVEVGVVPENRPGSLTDASRGEPSHAVFFVRDNGIGIHPRHFGQVFKIFKRLHGREDYGGGTGVGLTIVRKLVERHHGRIWIESAPGTGTTVYFTLPSGTMEAGLGN